jgi:hypothetical protein
MLPDFLKDSYKQYKADTDRFATWLVNVAKKCGYEPEDLTPTPSLDANGKGKRKKNTNQSKAPEPEKYQISIRELCKVAQAVSKSTVKVPTSVLTVAKRAITLRKDVTSYFVGQGNAASNQRHAHFIEVMKTFASPSNGMTRVHRPRLRRMTRASTCPTMQVKMPTTKPGRIGLRRSRWKISRM